MNVYPMELVLAEARKLQEQATALQAENAKLREEWREYQATIDSLVDECTDHKAENAKLREFAGQVLYFTTMTDGCGDNCPYSSSDCSHECHLREQGRELGIEVD